MIIYLEWLGVIAALLYVLISSRGSRLCFIFGLVSSVILAGICFVERLYFDTAINIYYVVMSVVGWIQWNQSPGDFRTSSISIGRLALLFFISLLISGPVGFAAGHFTDASLPYVDAFTTVTAVIATWLMVKKVVQNWLIWIISDGVAIFMYIYKDHFPIAALFAFYTAISFYGYFNWKRKLLQA